MDYDDMCEMLRLLTIPLGEKAADAIVQLQARVAELEALLVEARDEWIDPGYRMAPDFIRRINAAMGNRK